MHARHHLVLTILGFQSLTSIVRRLVNTASSTVFRCSPYKSRVFLRHPVSTAAEYWHCTYMYRYYCSRELSLIEEPHPSPRFVSIGPMSSQDTGTSASTVRTSIGTPISNLGGATTASHSSSALTGIIVACRYYVWQAIEMFSRTCTAIGQLSTDPDHE